MFDWITILWVSENFLTVIKIALTSNVLKSFCRLHNLNPAKFGMLIRRSIASEFKNYDGLRGRRFGMAMSVAKSSIEEADIGD